MRTLLLKFLPILVSATIAQSIFTIEQKSAIEDIINHYIADHPELITQSLQQAQNNELKKNTALAEEYLDKHVSALLEQTAPYSIGPVDAKVTLIEFSDYRCGYCKAAYQDLSQLLTKYPIKISFLQLPILGPQSTKAATIALSAASKAQFNEINKSLFSSNIPLDDVSLNKIAKSHNINILDDAVLQEKIKANYTWAVNLGIQGAPAIIVTNGKQNKIFLGRTDIHALEIAIKAMDALATPPSTINTSTQPIQTPKAA